MLRGIATVLLVWLGVACLRTSGAEAQVRAEPTQQLPTRGQSPPDGATLAKLPSGAWAITICRARPVTWFSEEMPPEARGMVEAHEAEHRRHMASFDSCEEFWAWRRADPEHEVIAEARAFCAGARYEHSRGKHPSFLKAIQAQALVFENYHVWTLEEATAAIIRNCDPAEDRPRWRPHVPALTARFTEE